ncbi:MAG: FtsQ-type POTRA domain-containing protein [Candidatus Berkelbacteria bacterium]|nr:FtsQ-type POTRA domain-containing protein [Candidatus Berkelbacteria bacterium]
MLPKEKYSYSKYRNQKSQPAGRARVFVGPKIKFSFNPIINLPAKFLGNLFIFILILAAAWTVFYSKYFQIKDVVVEGNNLIPAEQISTQIKTGGNIFRFNISAAKAKILASEPAIADVEIYRGLPDTLKVIVLEHKPTLVWQSQSRYFLLDESGVASKEISANDFADLVHVFDQKNLPVKVGDKIVAPSFINFADKINLTFFDQTNIHPTGFQVPETTLDLYVTTDAGFYIKFDTTRSFDTQIENLKKILIAFRPNIHEYVDVRINGWGYYK